jgi:hypothetical protein
VKARLPETFTRCCCPTINVPLPTSEPTLSWLLPSGPVLPEKSIFPPAPLIRWALPPSLLPENVRVPLFVMTALPAVLALKNPMPPPLFVMVAVPAVLVLAKVVWAPLPLFVIAALPAVLVSKKRVSPPLFVMVALLALALSVPPD